jgi:hypothetical protein
MNAREKTKNEEINFKSDALTDLPLADEQADRATGGSTNNQGHLIVGVDNVKLR